MGIWTDVFIAPAEPGLLVPRADFERLLLDLGRERLVVMPWVLLAGRLCVNASLNWGSVSGKARWDRTLPPGTVPATDEPWPEDRDDTPPPPWGDSHEEARILARGDGILGLLAAVREAPYGVEDIAAVFAGVDFGHRGIADWFRWEDHRTTVACFALASAQDRPLSTPDWADPSSRVHPVRTCLVHTFKHRFRYIPAPPLAAVAGRHLGAEPVVGRRGDEPAARRGGVGWEGGSGKVSFPVSDMPTGRSLPSPHLPPPPRPLGDPPCACAAAAARSWPPPWPPSASSPRSPPPPPRRPRPTVAAPATSSAARPPPSIVPQDGRTGPRPLITYAVGTVGLGDSCAPSANLPNGTAMEANLIQQYTQRGWAVVVTDYEGLGTPGVHTYTVGPSAGHAMLDAARAAIRLPGTGLSADTPVGIVGYSQGGQASSWAAELQGSYAPELKVKGTATGGVPADLLKVAASNNGSYGSGLIFMAAAGQDAAFPELGLDSYLNPAGRALVAGMKENCVAVDAVAGSFKRISDLTTRDPLAQPDWQARLNQSRLGRTAPAAPVLQYHALGDELIPYAVGRQLRAEWCARGADVQFDTIVLGEHVSGVITHSPSVGNWLADRFAGRATRPDC